MISFLESPAGLAAGIVILVATGVGTVAALRGYLSATPEPPRQRRSRGRRDRNRKPAARLGAQSTIPIYGPTIAAVLAAGCFLLPLTFSIFFDDVFALPKTALLWTMASLIGGLLALAALRGARPIGSRFLDLAAAGFVLLNVAATVLSSDPAHALAGERLQYQGLLSTVAYVVLFFGARYSISDARQVGALSVALGASGVLVATYGLLQWFGLDPIWSALWKDRIFSTMGQANMLACFLGIALVMSIALPVRGATRRTVALIGCALIAVALVLTFGRGGYLGVAAGLAVAGAVLLRGASMSTVLRVLPRIAAALATVALAIGVVAVIWEPAGTLVASVLGRAATIVDPSESSNQIRLDLWTVAANVIGQHPILGTGPDSYVLVFPQVSDTVLPAERAAHLALFRVESPHNVYLAVASGAGLPALAALFALLGGSLWMGVRAAAAELSRADRRALAALLGGVVTVSVAYLFMTAEPATSAIWFILLGALAGLAQRLRVDAADVPPA